MDIRVLEINEARDLVLRGWLPKDYADELDSMYIFGGYDQDNIICVAAFTDNFGKNFTVDFKYMYMHRDYRSRGLAKELYVFCENAFLNIGIKELDCNFIVDKDFAESRLNLLNTFGYAPMYIDWRVMRYDRGHFRGAKSDLLFSNIKKLGMTVETIEDYTDRRLLAFMEKRDETGIFISKDDYNPNMCAFVTINDKIEAALCMKIMDSKSIIVEGYYTSDKIKQQDQLLPFLMSYLVKKNEEADSHIKTSEVKDSSMDETIDKKSDNKDLKDFENIYVVCKKDYRADAITKTFGEAVEEYYQQLYIKRLAW